MTPQRGKKRFNAVTAAFVSRGLVLFALGVAFLLQNAMAAERMVGKVTRVWDGDTVQLEVDNGDRYNIRFEGVDAPEKGQAYWRASADWLKRTVNGKFVVVVWSKVDDYGRIVGKVTNAGEDLNLLLVCRGQAWHYVKYASEQSQVDRANYAACEARARAERQGLWAEANPEAPWDYRARSRRGNRSK
jgi:endonuclease YncB( thermonuclease family)